MKSKDIREAFLRFFEDQGHRRVQSSSLIPKGDPTLMFTNAGMNPFKNVFLGLEKVDYSRATSSQKCCRVSGKHNDFEMVGKTPRHHTFFEMLGNFSFGDYFKKQAIEFAYELFINIYKLPVDRLHFTVFRDDNEAYDLWKNHIGIPEERLHRFDEKENFWSMGDTGPCGPCSEIHYDFGPEYSCGKEDCDPSCGCNRFTELWNLVFMQFNRTENGKMETLSAPSVDTGAGLERLAAVLQGKDNNYHSDLFMPLINHLADKANIEYEAESEFGTALRVIADHTRASSFLIADGLLPSNEGRGYVLRRIIRRGIRFARKIGVSDPFLYEATGFVVSAMQHHYPELTQARELIARVVLAEEERFNSTILTGMSYFEDLILRKSVKKSKIIPGGEIFKLYDTFGVPYDFTKDLAEEIGFALDRKGFEAEMEKQRERARRAWKGSGGEKVESIYLKLSSDHKVKFTGYEEIETSGCKVVALIQNQKAVKEIKEGSEGEVILDRTPFYGETGGQVGDKGYLKTANSSVQVFDAARPLPDLIAHKVKVNQGILSMGDEVTAVIDNLRRKDIMRNHTATHLLHRALRDELGNHVKQAGSLVTPQRLRFDFTHFSPLSKRELKRIEHFVNEAVMENRPVDADIVSLEEALEAGAVALFDEKYEDMVRMISVESISKELCGGTHVNRTGDIGLFKIVSESSIAAGVRRIEALTGWGAFEYLNENIDLINQATERIKASKNELPTALEKILGKSKELEQENKKLKMKIAEGGGTADSEEAEKIDGAYLFIKRLDHLDIAGLREFSDKLKNKYKEHIIVLGTAEDKKALLLARVSPNLQKKLDAVTLIKKISGKISGSGGGRPDMAQAGGKKPEYLDQALAEAKKIAKTTLSKN